MFEDDEPVLPPEGEDDDIGGGGGAPTEGGDARREELLAYIRNRFESVRSMWDGEHMQPLIQDMCDFLSLTRTAQNEIQFSSPDSDKVLSGNDAIREAVRVFNISFFDVLDEYKKYDSALCEHVWLGGSSMELNSNTDGLKEMIYRVFCFVHGAHHSLLAYRTSLAMACSSEGYDSLPEQARSDRWLAACFSHKLTELEKRIKPAQFILATAITRLREGEDGHSYLLKGNQVFRRKKIPKTMPVMYEGEYICSECGEPESEHSLTGSVRDRRDHVFKPMEVPLGFVDETTGKMKPHMLFTHSYEKYKSVKELLEDVCDPDIELAMHTASMSGPQTLSFVEARLCSMPSVPKLSPRRGFIGFNDGSWDVEACTFYGNECTCNNSARRARGRVGRMVYGAGGFISSVFR